jgi:hypothetical protein
MIRYWIDNGTELKLAEGWMEDCNFVFILCGYKKFIHESCVFKSARQAKLDAIETLMIEKRELSKKIKDIKSQ